MDFETSTGTAVPQRPRPLWLQLIVLGLTFLAGIAAAGWGLSRWDTARTWLFGRSEAGREAEVLPLATLPGAAALPPGMTAPDLAARMVSLEARMAKIEASAASGGVGNSTRAEGLLVSFAARRAIDRGLGLGYVEGLLTQRFGITQPRAVAAIIAAGQRPVTLEQLASGLRSVAPGLVGSAADESWWSQFKHGLAGIFIVREAGTVSVEPEARVERAFGLIEAGQVDLALAEVSRLPRRDRAAAWIAQARRYVEAHRALDLLEAAAIVSGDQPSRAGLPQPRLERPGPPD